MVLTPWNIEGLKEIEKETGKKVYSILQLRLHPALLTLREKIIKDDPNKIYDVNLTYITSRENGIMQVGKVMFKNRGELRPISVSIFLIC